MKYAKHLRSKTEVKKQSLKYIVASEIILLIIILFNTNGIYAYFKSIYAKENPISIESNYTITFNSNTGTGSMSNQEMSYNEIIKLNKNIYKKTGYSFTNWNTKADNTGISYTNEEEVINLGNITLYAQWELNPTRYAVQIYGINQDVDEEDNVLGLTFGPALGADYNNAYVTHRYVKNDEGTYNIEIVTSTVDANGNETQTTEILLNGNNEAVTRLEEQVQKRQNINLHNMSWEEIANVEDKTLFEDCMLCGDTKRVELILNSTIKSNELFNQYGDGSGMLMASLSEVYKNWNPSYEQNEYIGNQETGVELDSNEINNGSNARNAGGYSSSHIRATLIGENEKTNRGYAGDVNLTQGNCLFSCIQEDLRYLIVPKKVKYITGTSQEEGNYTINEDIADPIWLFSAIEINGTGSSSDGNLEGISISGDAYNKFTNTNSKYYISTQNDSSEDCRKAYSEKSILDVWWLRSVALFSRYGARDVSTTGNLGYNTTNKAYGMRIWLLYFRCKI